MSWNKIILGLMISSSLYFVACTGHQSSELVAKSVAGKGHMPDKATTEEMNDVEKAMYDHLEVLQNNAFQAHQVVSETVKRIIYCKSGNCDNLNVASYTAPRTQFQILSDVIGAIRQVFKNAPTHKTTQTTLSNEGYNAAQSVSGDYDKACPANVNNKTTPQAPTQTTDNSQDPANKAQRSDLSMPKTR